MSPTPFRDDRESLAAENARLRQEVVGLRSQKARRFVRIAGVVVMLAADAYAFEFVRTMINARSDGQVAAGFAVMLVAVVANIFVALRLFQRGD